MTTTKNNQKLTYFSRIPLANAQLQRYVFVSREIKTMLLSVYIKYTEIASVYVCLAQIARGVVVAANSNITAHHPLDTTIKNEPRHVISNNVAF